MPLDKVIEDILKTGKREAREIIEEGEKEKQSLLGKAREEGSAMLESRIKESEEYVQRMNTQEIARAELESKKIILGSQKEVLDMVYETALERLKNLPNNQALLRTLISRNQDEVSDGRVYCNQRDEAFVRSLVGPNFGGILECAGGIVIESMDGSRRIDLRYETRLKDIWEDSIKEISDILWGE